MKFRTRIAAITAAVAISAPAGVMLLSTPAFAWHANSDCVNNKWVVENPSEEWATDATFTFDDGTVASPIEPGQEVAAPAAANHVTVTWVDYGTPHSYDRPEGCHPPVVYTPAIMASGDCIDNHSATISGSTNGFPDGELVLFAQRADVDYGSNAGTANGSFSFLVDVSNINGPQTGSMTFDIVAQQDDYSANMQVTVDFSKCQPVVVTTTQPAPTTTQPPAPTTTQPAPTTTVAPTTTQPAPTTTQPPAPTTTQPAPTTTVKPPTSTLPATGSSTTTGTALIAFAVLLAGILLVMITRRRPRLG